VPESRALAAKHDILHHHGNIHFRADAYCLIDYEE